MFVERTFKRLKTAAGDMYIWDIIPVSDGLATPGIIICSSLTQLQNCSSYFALHKM